MSMFRGPAGLPSLLKEGTRHYQGDEEAVLRNIDTCKRLSEMLKRCYGPTSMQKLVSNFIEKRFLTADANAVLTELEIQHPAAKMLVLAAQMQATEFGDGTNFTVLFAAELLDQARKLMQQGIRVPIVIEGYELALQKTLEIVERQVVYTLPDMRNREELMKVVRPVLTTKIKELDDNFTELVVDACLVVLSEDGKQFDTDSVRVSHLVGGSLADSFLVDGMVLMREPMTVTREVRDARIVVLANALEPAATEGSSTVVMHNTEELKSFSKTEEAEIEAIVKGFVDAGVTAMIVGGHITPLALHYLDKAGIMAVVTSSRWDIKRLCRTLRVPALQRLAPPMDEEIGLVEFMGVEEYGSQLITVVRGRDTSVSTVVLRGTTRTFLEEVERAIDDAVSLVKACTKDARFVAGGSACETEMAQQIQTYATTLSGLKQYSVDRFGRSFHVFGRQLAESAGQNSLETLAQMQAEHKAGRTSAGVDVTRTAGKCTRDVTKELDIAEMDPASAFENATFPVLDHYMTKRWGIRLAVDAALTVLRVDQIIMAKPAGGPKFPNRGNWDAQDDLVPIK